MLLLLRITQILCFLLIQNYVSAKIINGTDATMEDAQFTVSIRKREDDEFFFGNGHLCGGSLITRNVVVSAAHCFLNYEVKNGSYLDANEFLVTLGNLDRYKKDKETIILSVSKLLPYKPILNLTALHGDIMLVYLNQSVPIWHPTVQPISLNSQKMPPGTICRAIGWGENENSEYPSKLKRVDVPLIANKACAKALEENKKKLLKGMLCAGYLNQGQRDSCRGDSGGPLVCKKILTGIVSWGPRDCGSPLFPGVYMDVAYYYSWIDKNSYFESEDIIENNTSHVEYHYATIIFLIGNFILRTYELFF